MNLISSDAIQFILYFIVPGVVAITIRDSMVASERRNWQEMSFALIAYGFINLLIFGIFSLFIQFLPVIQIPLLVVPQKVNGIALLFLDVLIPMSVAWISVRIPKSRLTRRFFRRLFMDPIPTPWDFIFSNHNKCYCLTFHMKDGSLIIGIYGASSRVSSFPRPKEVYVEQLCTFDEQNGVIDRKPGNSGALISMDECRFVELVELPAQHASLIKKRSISWPKMRSLIEATLIRPFNRFSRGRFSRHQTPKSYVKVTAPSSSQPQMLSLSTIVPISQSPDPLPTKEELQHQQLIQDNQVLVQPAQLAQPSNKGRAAN